MSLFFKGITKVYDKRKVVDSVHFEIRNGEIMGFAGINGAGKTTAMKIAAGVIHPDSGDVLVDGISMLKEGKRAKFNITWVPENSLLDPFRTPISTFLEYGSYLGFTRSMISERSEKAMEDVGLNELMKRRIGSFSNGMKKRLMIAFSLFQDPTNFLLDETFTGLDPKATLTLREILIRLRDKKKSVLLSSHVLSELDGIVDRMAIIHSGRIVSIANTDEISRFSVLAIKCEGDKYGVAAVLETFGEVTTKQDVYELIPSNGTSANQWVIGIALENAGYKVMSIEQKGNAVERYFFEKIGEP